MTTMRNFNTLIKDIVTKPFWFFPIVGLFHLFWLVWVIWGLRGEKIGSFELIRVGWMIGYTLFWLAACDLRKWGALGYLGLTLLNLILYFNLKSPVERSIYTSSLFLIDVVFSLFLLFFYKQFK